MVDESQDKKAELLKLVRDAVQKDAELRENYRVGEKFRFIRDRLNALLSKLEENMRASEKAGIAEQYQLPEDETLVYVYLYNTHGLDFKTWNKMVNPSVFYEYSVNRPIYDNKSFLTALIKTKATKTQHAYLTFAIKKDKILRQENVKDPLGHELIKVKEGALKPDKVIGFTFNGHEYSVSPTGELRKRDQENN